MLGPIANLLFQMLSRRSDQEGISAQTVLSIAEYVNAVFPRDSYVNPTEGAEVTGRGWGETVSLGTMITAARVVESIGLKLQQYTAAFFADRRGIETVQPPVQDDEAMREVSAAFDRAKKRTEVSWKLGVLMTLIAFSVIVTMIACAVILTVVTGKSYWGALFGSLGVASVIGTLLWKPYDRLFHATILAQQIEMVHVTMVTGYRATPDLQERVKVCREAFTALQTIFRDRDDQKFGKTGPSRAVRKKKT